MHLFTLADHRQHEQAAANLYPPLKEIIREIFKGDDFALFRQEQEKAFIKEKRLLEAAEKKYPKPYLDYLDEEEEAQFLALWETHRTNFLFTLLTGEGEPSHFTDELRLWHSEILKGAHSQLTWLPSFQNLKKGLDKLPKNLLRDYLATLRTFSELDRPLSHALEAAQTGSFMADAKAPGPRLLSRLWLWLWPHASFSAGQHPRLNF